jgi:hypothetical protein
VSPEHELTLRLASCAASREAADARIAELAGRADFELLARMLSVQLLLPLAAQRLEESSAAPAPEAFRRFARQEAGRWRELALGQGAVTESLLRLLEDAGIPAAPVKGALLAEEIYGDPGLRFSSDIDLLVDGARLEDALAVLRRAGYGASTDEAWQDGRPLLHHALPPERPGLPPLDLHWRIHWNETELSRELLARAVPHPPGGRRLRPEDELLSLLLFFGRNSFYGLRLAADVAASWDRHRDELEPGFLDPVLAARPELRDVLTASVLLAERLVGLPSAQLGSGWEPTQRARLATRLANWEMAGSEAERTANMVSVDWLLSPPGQWRAFARRHMFHPTAELGPRLLHGVARTGKFAVRHARIRWRVRGGGAWCPMPSQRI